MLSYAHLFVRLLGRLNDGHHCVLTTISTSGDAMRLIVVSRDCQCWETKITEPELIRERDSLGASSPVSWSSFFDMFQKSFVERSIEFTAPKQIVTFSLRHDRSTEAFPAAPFTASMNILVKPVGAGGNNGEPHPLNVSSVVQSLIEFMPMRLGERKEQDRIDEQARAADLLKEDCERNVEECDLLMGWRDRFTQEAANAEAELAELSRLLDASNDPDVANNWRTIVDQTPSTSVLNAVRDPLAGPSGPIQLKFNFSLLKQIKATTGFSTFVVPNLNSGSSAASTYASHVSQTASSHNDNAASSLHLRCCNLIPYDKKGGGGPKPDPAPEDEEAVLALLVGIDDWGNFDSLELDKACRKCKPTNEFGALFYLGYYAFMKLGIASRFNISEATLLDFLAAVERGYDPALQFHNAIHAVEVLYTVNFVLAHAEFARKARLTDTQVLAMVLAALVVDIDHAGIGNTAHGRANSLLNIVHCGQSVTEAHHVAFALSLLAQHRYNILDCVATAKVDTVRTLLAEFLLATDPLRGQGVLRCVQKQILDGLDLNDTDTCGMVCCLTVMAADACFPAKPTHIYSRWVHGLINEQNGQSAVEEALGIPRSAPPHGNADERAMAHLGFINTLTQPMFAALSEILPQLRMTGEFVAANKLLWGAVS